VLSVSAPPSCSPAVRRVERLSSRCSTARPASIPARRISQQVKDLDPLTLGLLPGPHRFAPVSLQVIEDQEDLFRRVLNQAAHEFDQGLRRRLLVARKS
jgi:hypothetical protein